MFKSLIHLEFVLLQGVRWGFSTSLQMASRLPPFTEKSVFPPWVWTQCHYGLTSCMCMDLFLVWYLIILCPLRDFIWFLYISNAFSHKSSQIDWRQFPFSDGSYLGVNSGLRWRIIGKKGMGVREFLPSIRQIIFSRRICEVSNCCAGESEWKMNWPPVL